jgi:hypothetical protein
MSVYRFLQDAYIANLYFPAGSIASTQDVGGLLSTGWVPGPYVDPLDIAATNAFYATGPKPLTFQFGTLSFLVAAPATYWLCTPGASGSGTMSYQLTGLAPVSQP